MDIRHTHDRAHEIEEDTHWRREEFVAIFGVYLILVGISLGYGIYTKELVGFVNFYMLL